MSNTPKPLSFGVEAKSNVSKSPQPLLDQHVKPLSFQPVDQAKATTTAGSVVFDDGKQPLTELLISTMKKMDSGLVAANVSDIGRMLAQLLPLDERHTQLVNWGSTDFTQAADTVREIAELSMKISSCNVSDSVSRVVEMMRPSSRLRKLIKPASGKVVDELVSMTALRDTVVALIPTIQSTKAKLDAVTVRVALRLLVLSSVNSVVDQYSDIVQQSVHNKYRVASTVSQQLVLSGVQLNNTQILLIDNVGKLEELIASTIPTYLATNV